MMSKLVSAILVAALLLQACVFVVQDKKTTQEDTLTVSDSSAAFAPVVDTLKVDSIVMPDSLIVVRTPDSTTIAPAKGSINTKGVHPQQLVDFAKTLIGIRYKYGSTNPDVGFDCSGFITYVFSKFNIIVPRSSIDFTYVGKEIRAEESKLGDIVLFTGTDSTERFVGHMGIIISNDASGISFIHSTSGKAYGVTITPLNGYYRGRYVKTIRIFPENDR